MSKPIFAFVGGLGQQGESCIHAIAASQPGLFHFRILARDTSTPKAQALKQKYGADIEFVQGNQLYPADIDKLLQGASWAFVVTNFWDQSVMLKEGEIGRAIADSAKKNGVKNLIYSTLPHAKKISGGKYDVPHFDLKAEVQEYINKLGLNAAFIAPTFYYQNWTSFFVPRPNADGTYSITLPSAKDSRIASFDVSETGNAVAEIVKHWEEWKGKVFTIAGDNLQVQEYVQIIAQVTGLQISLNTIPYDVFKGFAGAEITDMLHYYQDFGFDGTDSWKTTTQHIRVTSFKDWAAKNAENLKPKAGGH